MAEVDAIEPNSFRMVDQRRLLSTVTSIGGALDREKRSSSALSLKGTAEGEGHVMSSAAAI